MLTFPDSFLFHSGLEQSLKMFYLSCGNKFLKIFCSRKLKTLFFTFSKIKCRRQAHGDEWSSQFSASSEVQWCQMWLHSISWTVSTMCGAWKLLGPVLSWVSSPAFCPAVLQSLGAATPELELDIIICQGTQPCRTDKKAPAWVWQKFPDSKIFSRNILALTYGHESITSSWLVRNRVGWVGGEAHYGSWTILVALMPVTCGRIGLFQRD